MSSGLVATDVGSPPLQLTPGTKSEPVSINIRDVDSSESENGNTDSQIPQATEDTVARDASTTDSTDFADQTPVSDIALPEDLTSSANNAMEEDAEVELTEDEDPDMITIDLDRENRGSFLADSLKERKKKAPKRVMQAMSYARLLEDRVCALEENVQELTRKMDRQTSGNVNTDTETSGDVNIDTETSEDTDTDPKMKEEEVEVKEEKKKEFAPGIHRISRVTMEEYQEELSKNRKGPDNDGEDHQATLHTIDVVFANAQQIRSVTSEGAADGNKSNGNETAISEETLQTSSPERIRINSPLLLRCLAKITGRTLGETRTGKKSNTQIFLKPFKLFVAYEEKIRDYAKALEKKIATVNDSLGADTKPDDQGGCEDGAKPTDEDTKLDSSTSNATDSAQHDDEDGLESLRCHQELQFLINVFDTDLESVFSLRDRIRKKGLTTIAFENLWHLFRHGEEICSTDEHPQVYKILNVTGGRQFFSTLSQAEMDAEPNKNDDDDDDDEVNTTLYAKSSVSIFSIHCLFYDFDGKDYGPVDKMFRIAKYEGLRPLTKLPCFPLACTGALKHALSRDYFIKRGTLFIDFAQSQQVVHKYYHGLTLEDPEEVDSEVIIDMQRAMLQRANWKRKLGIQMQLEVDKRETVEIIHPSCEYENCCWNPTVYKDNEQDKEDAKIVRDGVRVLTEKVEQGKKLLPEELVLFPGRVYGFILRKRDWAAMDVMLMEPMDVRHQAGGFESLVLPPGHKDTLLALVTTHSKGGKIDKDKLGRGDRQMDVVRGKGKGLIILLHGQPGVGKTSTAECVAEYTKRPLFSVTCADIGQTAEQVEETLSSHFQLAHRWGCVMLLDEAEIFLLKRDKRDLERNAIVSVFLRVLEYYPGILFLTTNRVGVIDPAFRSRLHMQLYYPRLREEATLKIWEMHLAKVKADWKEMRLVADDEAAILSFARQHYKESETSRATWNGRQIRNAFQTALALAEYEAYKMKIDYDIPEVKPKLMRKHFETVAKASKDFDEYLREQGGDPEETAYAEGERVNDYAMPG